jgi:hypothetical protein
MPSVIHWLRGNTTFDTLKFVDRLKAAGMPEEQARALVGAQRRDISHTFTAAEPATYAC